MQYVQNCFHNIFFYIILIDYVRYCKYFFKNLFFFKKLDRIAIFGTHLINYLIDMKLVMQCRIISSFLFSNISYLHLHHLIVSILSGILLYPKNRIFVKIAFAGRFLLQKLTVFLWFPLRFSWSPTNNLKTSSRVGTHWYLVSASYLKYRQKKNSSNILPFNKIKPLTSYTLNFVSSMGIVYNNDQIVYSNQMKLQ